ncbi:MAG TPA: DUF916 domain-containing protein [Egibacteraceae bacterium]|nr:DUF916 domain-containing protein [Egibacteraceae bacterium]
MATTAVLQLLLPVAHAAEPSTAFVARPADGSSTADGGWFLYDDVAPGAALSGELAVRNDSGGPLTLRIAAADAQTAQQGGVSYSLPGEELERVGRWLDLSRETVELAPGQGEVVPFTVAVPGDARPGDHLAGIAVWAPGAGDEPPAGEGPGAGVVIETRQVIAVQVTVPGSAAHELEVKAVRIAARPSGPFLEVTVANTGTLLTKAQARVLVDGEPAAQALQVETIVPGTSFGLPVEWPFADLDDAHHVAVELDYEGGTARWEGTLDADDEVRAALEDWAAPGTGEPSPPVVVILLGAVVAALVILLSLVRWWRRRAGELGSSPAHVDSGRSS